MHERRILSSRYCRTPANVPPEIDEIGVVMSDAVRTRRSRIALDRSPRVILKRLVLVTTLPVFAAASLFGCQSAQEKADATKVTMAATSESDTTQTILSDSVATAPSLSEQAIGSKTTTSAAPKPKATAPIDRDSATTAPSLREEANATVVTTTTAPKLDAPQTQLPASVVTAAKAAFEKNKCGMCHSVGEFAAAKEPTKKHDLSSVGIVHSAAWISGWLEKKESVDGKLHSVSFKGTDAERAALSQWLASLKSESQPK